MLLGLTQTSWSRSLLLAVWSFVFAVESPLRQAFINGLIPSEQRATVLSFDSLMALGRRRRRPAALGRVADVNGYGPAYLVSAGISALALPFVAPRPARARRLGSDPPRRGRAAGPRDHLSEGHARVA